LGNKEQNTEYGYVALFIHGLFPRFVGKENLSARLRAADAASSQMIGGEIIDSDDDFSRFARLQVGDTTGVLVAGFRISDDLLLLSRLR
jgi:hypothetical protein